MKRLGLPLAVMGSILLLLLHLVPGQPEHESTWNAQATTYSYGPAGGRALYMLLQKLGLTVERLRRPDYAGLDADSVLWVLTEEPFGRIERRSILAFVQRGGTLVAPPKALAGVLEEAGLGKPVAHEQSRDGLAVPHGNLQLQLEHMPKALLGVQDEPMQTYLTSAEGNPVVAAWAVGHGKVVSLGAPELVLNDRVGLGGHGVFLARLALGLGQRHVFDEFKTGFGEGDIMSLLARVPYRWGLLQAALVACVALWGVAQRRLLVQATPVLRRRNSLDHVEAVAQLWAGAEDAGLPLAALLTAFQERAQARLGGASDAEPFVRWVASVRPERRVEAAACWAQAQQLMKSPRPPVDAARQVVAQLGAMEEEGMRW